MTFSGTITTRNVMATWGDRGKYEGRDDDSRIRPAWECRRVIVFAVLNGGKSDSERRDPDTAE